MINDTFQFSKFNPRPTFRTTRILSPMATTALSSLSKKLSKSYVVLLMIFFSCLLRPSEATDILVPGQDLRDNKTLVSSNKVFELGFFNTGGSSSSNYYLGIWFRDDPYKKPVWVANREYPLIDSSGVLSIRYDGNLVISDKRRIQYLVNAVMLSPSNSTSSILLDSGNFVLMEGISTVWESFYYPTDTFLPGMKLGFFDIGTDKMRNPYLVSWQSPSVPSTGSFVLTLPRKNKTQLGVWHHDEVFRQIGYYDGRRFRFLFNSSLNEYNFTYVSSITEIYISFANKGNDIFSWFVISPSGEIQAFSMIGKEISVVYSPICANTSSNNAADCYIEKPPLCADGNNFSRTEGFMPNPNVFNESDGLGISDCEIMCRSNCSCTAFTSYRDDSTGCQFYYGDIEFTMGETGQGNRTMFVRGNFTKTTYMLPRNSGHRRKRLLWLILTISLVVFIISALVVISRWKSHTCIAAWKEKGKKPKRSLELFLMQLESDVSLDNRDSHTSKLKSVRKRDRELPILGFSCLSVATNNFSPVNELGEGGFGRVYKGTLLGHEIAVKRLSRKSGQGPEEFKNEVQLVSKLQHRNLVRLLGCCIEREEKILIYEYMANKSLDSFLFDPHKKPLLEWKRRMFIIQGIAQGLLYLHQYSRLRIIHRDLKTSNILLDKDMNPKIADFGMARIFGENQVRAKTTRVVGTYGYMSPEYAVHGLFSTKSDVFSFGVIMLEIISGRRNTTFTHSDRSLNLLGYAWELWKSGQGGELMDLVSGEPPFLIEFSLCLHIALLCVQEHPEDRPDMSDVVSMLSKGSSNMPSPKEAAFSSQVGYRGPQEHRDFLSSEITYSTVEAR
ncbi:G-type lectin S-receptor-like serine/threonine-protein kinase SD1-13 isoform X1 [Rhodamnia argentea]|uniref:Receptor-like serine/threonine-protein kinase n=1 Tax=Rhodamnia argentea TaxID=178133 RepID=A0A8B8QSL5_9MYRT|nr:G-type lectin S-receptor-like serine/threonine-protein kinase SD1-13 isoform X1 [Rhodamnia argentea]